MKKLLKRIDSCDVRLWYSLALLFFSFALLCQVYSLSLVRFFESLKDLGTSLIYYFLFAYAPILTAIFGEFSLPHTSLLDMPSTSLEEVIGIDFALILERLKLFPEVFGSSFGEYNAWLFEKIYFFLLYFMFFSPFLIVLPFIIKHVILSPKDTESGYISKPARGALWLVRSIFLPVKQCFSAFLDYLCEHKVIAYLLLAIWLLNFNVLTAIVEAFAFYFYFISSFDFSAFLFLLLRIILDSLILLFSMPLLYWLLITARIYYRVREYKALDQLRHFEAQNCGFLKTLDIVMLIIGEPGKGKTTLLTDFVLSFVNIYKAETLKTLYRYQLLFPGFAFARYRKDIMSRIETHELYCLPQIHDLVDDMFARYEEGDTAALYGYDKELFKTSRDVGNRDISLQEALKTYGKAFMIYYNNNPSLSNYPIRFDGNFDDSKHLKKWDGDFFRRKKESRFSHILNQDMLRHGTKVDDTSREIGAFGYGIYSHTELAKSVGNKNTNAVYDAESEEANPKNDKHSYSYMMGRHPYSTVDNFVYFRYIGDEQRASSLMAEELGLMSVLSIGEKGDQQIAIDGFAWLFSLRDRIGSRFKKFSEDRENVRSDVTLSMLTLQYIVSAIELSCLRLENRFGYREVRLDRQQGSAFSGNSGTANTAGEVKSHIYYQMNMKDYSDRFMTDCYSKLYANAQKACGMGIMDMRTYGSLDMSVEEMDYQRDYFLRRLMTMIHGEADFNVVKEKTVVTESVDPIPPKPEKIRNIL